MSPVPTAAAAGVLIEAPAPRPPLYTLIGAATVVPMGADEHYNLGVALRNYPCGPAHAWDGWNHVGAEGETEKILTGVLANPAFRGFGVYLREECNARGLDGARYAERVARIFPTVEAYGVEREFWTSELIAANLGLTSVIPAGGPDATIYPTGDTVQTLVEGIALLEGAIATTGRAGMIHMSPTAFTHLVRTGTGVVSQSRTNPATLQTMLGTTVVPGYGYQTAATIFNGSTPVPPSGHAPPTGTQEWIVATGQVEVRRSEQIEMIPEATDAALWQAFDRSNNLLAYEAIRYYVVDWDACFKAAVRVDRAT